MYSLSRRIRPHPRTALRVAAWCSVLLLAASGGCGKKGPPLPPVKRGPARVARLDARQVGDRIVLWLPRPASRVDESPLGADAGIEIAMTAREPAPKRPEEIAARPAAVWSIPASEWDRYMAGTRRLEVGLRLERLLAALEPAEGMASLTGKRLSFTVVVTEARNRRSEPSPIAGFTVCDAPPPPRDTSVRLTEEGLLIRWVAPVGSNAGFNLYRQDRGAPPPDRPIHQAPLRTTRFLDGDAIEGKPYRYFLRTLGATDGCESADGAIVPATRIDLFPPLPPQGLAAVTEQGAIRLFWRPGRESDLKGYRVYRADGPDAPWRLLTPEDLTTTSYTDREAVAGVRYSYAVTARDRATPPNESDFSVPTIETMESRP